jgi:hypothetical protein
MTAAVPTTPRQASVYQVVRPFVLLAVVAFLVGFLGYLALGRQELVSTAQGATAAVASPAVASPASDDWNLPKHI